MMNWWLERGIAGFRMDVINLIAKEPDRGITADGPKLHDYLQEMHRETLAGRDVMTVGEALERDARQRACSTPAATAASSRWCSSSSTSCSNGTRPGASGSPSRSTSWR